ncbi:MAG: NUDIX hydrolase [Bacteroidota bacterium]
MYKVFINHKEINFLQHKAEEEKPNELSINKNDFGEFYELFSSFENNPDLHTLNIYGDLPDNLFRQFASHFNIIEAAGGIVINSRNDILFIFRHNKWDLPKGKIEKGESPEEAALREIEEECGISEIKISKFISHTYHIYSLDGINYALKKTWWYEVLANEKESFHPQKEEGIEDIKWFPFTQLNDALSSTYASLKLLIETYLKS